MESPVPVVQLEHPVRDFQTWKAAFDRDPVDRKGSGVRAYRIYRPTDDPSYVAVDLEFDGLGEAEAFKLALQELWRSSQAAAAFAGTPRVRVVEMVEGKSY
jgi:hypothetical protein